MTNGEKTSRGLVLGLIVLVFALVFLAATCAFQVRITQVAIVSTFGRPGTPITEPGLYFKAPLPIQRVVRFDRRQQLLRGRMREVLTQDGLNVVVKPFAVWSVADANRFYERVGLSTEDGSRVLAGLLDKHMADVIGGVALSDFVTTQAEEGRGLRALETMVRSRMLSEAEDYGVEVATVGVEQLSLPESITKAVFERMKADRERLTAKVRSEGERDARIIRTAADRRRAEILSEADAAATRIRGEGESEAFKALQVFEQDPEFALFLRKLEALESTLKSKSTLILDRDTPPYDLLKRAPAGAAAEKKTDSKQ